MMAMSVRKPPPVTAGDRVGVAALSGPVDPQELRTGLAAMEALGLVAVPADNLLMRQGMFAGGEQERLDGFHRLLADTSLKAVIFARGGHGLLPLLPKIDWSLLEAHPKALMGYSDLTPLLLQTVERVHLVAFHGPMIAKDFARGLTPEEQRFLSAALRGERLEYSVTSISGEIAEGRLMGGCLSLLASLAGTPFAPDLDGAILFLEDVQEPLYRIDRMLHQLDLCGMTSGIRGVVFGWMLPPEEQASTQGWASGWREFLEDWADRWEVPVAHGLAAGHAAPNLTLPFGVRARLLPSGRLEVDPG